MGRQHDNAVNRPRKIFSVAILLLTLLLPVVGLAQVLMQDDFNGAAASPPDAAKFTWGGQVGMNGTGQLNLNTDTASTSWLQSITNAVPRAGESLVLRMRLSAYAEPAVYGDLQPRGLRVGNDANNVIEFYSIYGTTLGLRTRNNGVESLISCPFPQNVYAMHDYEISVTTATAVFTVDGVVAGTITNNLPTGALNAYVSTYDGGFGNVPVTLDSMELSLTNDAVVTPSDLTWTTNNGEITITGYTGTGGTVTIPATINGMPVTQIGPSAFNEYYQAHVLTGIVIPDSVTNISDTAFNACSSLTQVTIGQGLVSLGYHVFYSCSGLLAFVVNPLNPAFSSLDGVLFNHDQTTLIQYPAGLAGSYAIPGTVTNIGAQAFANCNGLTGVSIPDSVASIEPQAFYSCANLAWATIPDSVTNALNQTFVWCYALTNAVVGNGVTSLDGTFSQCSGLAKVSIGNSVSNISGAFVNCSGLKNVLIPSSVTTLGDMAFAGCGGLTNLVLPGSVTRLGDSVFSACGSLPQLVIPDSVTSMGNYAFHYCTSLTNVGISASLPSLGYDAFAYCTHLTSVFIPNSVTNIGTEAFLNCYALTNATLGNGVIEIGSSAFYACTNLSELTISGSVVTIGNYAFDACKNLTGATIPDSVTSIGDHAFDGAGLISITLGNSVTNIGSYAFGWCYALGSITIPASVASIGYLAFEQCFSLAAITVEAGNPVYRSGDGVLFDASGTTLIAYPPGKAAHYTIPSSVTAIGDGAFYYCSGLTNVVIPDSVTDIGSEAFFECTGLTRITLPNSVTNIGNSAFAYSGLSSATVGSGVTNIESYAFYSCAGLTSVYFAGNAPTLGSGVFYNANNPTIYYLPNTADWSGSFGGQPAVLWNPKALTSDATFGLHANQFGFTIAGGSNLVIIVEASTNLANPVWMTVGTNTLDTFVGTNGTSYFSDPQWTNYPKRFYRLRAP